MRLGLYYAGSAPEPAISWYGIGIKVGDNIAMGMYPPPAELPRLQAMLPAIEAMAKEVLGEDFIKLVASEGLPVLELTVRMGTSTGPRRFDFRDFCG